MGSPTGRRLSLVLTMIVISLAACTDSRAPTETVVIASRTADTIPAGHVLELSFTHRGVFDDKFRDVTLEAVFTAPGGGRQRIKGFFYGGEAWKIRIRPHEVGGWSYTYLMTGKGGLRSEGDGAFVVIVGEQGNRGMNWDPRSGLRMRVRLWTALFQEISLVFWNTSWAKDGMFHGRPTPSRPANIYLGPEERGYVRVLQDFSARLDANLRMASVELSLPGGVRGYGLRSTSVAAAYLHHVEDHVNEVRGLTVTLDGPDSARPANRWLAEWIEPRPATWSSGSRCARGDTRSMCPRSRSTWRS